MKRAVRIEYMELGAIIPARTNPKQHDLGAIHESIDRRGFVMPLLVDDETGRLVAGHGRLEALLQRKAQGKTAPDRIQVTDDGAWLVPVIRGVGFKNEVDAEAYLVADNQITILGGFDDAVLLHMLQDVSTEGLLGGTGFDLQDIDQLLRDVDGDSGNSKEDDVPPEPKKATAKRGEVWQLGEHKLMCGDCTDKADMAKLVGEERAALIVTDPPWGVNYEGAKMENGRVLKKPSRKGEGFANDDTTGIYYQMFDPLFEVADEKAAAYVFFSGRLGYDVYGAVQKSKWEVRQLLFWNKQHFPPSLGHYKMRSEPFLYLGKEKASVRWNGPTNEVSVWDCDKPARSPLHPTQKPVQLYVRAIRNHTNVDDIVLDGFSGSGTLIVACEQTGRRARAMEIEPKYVDVAVKRWEQMTGRKATRNGGKNCG